MKGNPEDSLKIETKRNPEDSLKIENIVASAKIAESLDLQVVSSQIKDAEYNKNDFPE